MVPESKRQVWVACSVPRAYEAACHIACAQHPLNGRVGSGFAHAGDGWGSEKIRRVVGLSPGTQELGGGREEKQREKEPRIRWLSLMTFSNLAATKLKGR